MMGLVRENKIEKVIVYSFSRFARSVTHLLSALEEFRSQDVSFLSYTEQVDTNTPMGRAFFTVIAAISQLERELIVERVKNGLKNARAKGKHIGRKKTRPSELIRALLKSDMSLREFSRTLKVSHGSVSLEKALMKKEAAALAVQQAKAEKQAQEALEMLEKEAAMREGRSMQVATFFTS